MNIHPGNGEEWVPLVDESGRVTGKVLRSQVHNGSFLLHPVVHLHVIGPGNTLLLQKRPLHKDIQPGKWDTAVGGHICFGESPLEALAREAEEETGLKTFTPRLLRSYVWTSDVEREFVHIFVTREYVATDLNLHPEPGRCPSPDLRQSLEPELNLVPTKRGLSHNLLRRVIGKGTSHPTINPVQPSDPYLDLPKHSQISINQVQPSDPDCDPGPETPVLVEVEALRFWKVEEIVNSLGAGVFTPNFEHDFQLLIEERYLSF